MAYVEFNVEQVTRAAELLGPLPQGQDLEDSLSNVIDPRIDLSSKSSNSTASQAPKDDAKIDSVQKPAEEEPVYPDIPVEVARYLASEPLDLCIPCAPEAHAKPVVSTGGSPLRAPLSLTCNAFALKQSTIGNPQDSDTETASATESKCAAVTENWAGSIDTTQKDLPSVHLWRRQSGNMSARDDTHSVCSETESTFSFWSHDGEPRSQWTTVAVQTEADMLVARLEGELEALSFELTRALQEKADLQLSDVRTLVARREEKDETGMQQVRDLEERILELESEALRYRRVVGDFEGLVTQKDSEVEVFREELARRDSYERELRANLEECKVELEARTGASDGLKRKIADLHVEVQRSKDEKAKLDGQNHTLRSELATVQKSKEWFRQQLHESQQSRDEIHRSHVASQAERIALTAEVQQLRAAEARVRRELAALQQRSLEEKAELARRLEEIEAQWVASRGVTTVAVDGADAQSNVPSTVNGPEVDGRMADLEHQLGSATKALALKEESLLQANGERMQIARDLHEVQQKLNESELLRLQCEERLQNSVQGEKRLQAELGKALEDLQALRSEQAQTLSALTVANEEKAVVEASVSELSANIVRLEANFKILHNQLLAKCAQVEELEKARNATVPPGAAEGQANLDSPTEKRLGKACDETVKNEGCGDKNSARSQKSSLSAMARKLRETREQLQHTKAELEQYHLSATTKADHTEDASKVEIQRLLVQLEKEQGKLEGCRQAQAQFGRHAAALERQLAEKEAELTQLFYQLKQAEEKASAATHLRDAQVEGLSQELLKEQSVTKDTRQKVYEEKKRCARLNSQLIAAKEALQESQALVQAKQQQVQSLQNKLQEKEYALAQNSSHCKGLMEQVGLEQQRVRELESQLLMAEERDPALEQHIKLLSWKVKEESQQVAALKEAAALAEKAHREEVEAVRKTLKEAQKRCQSMSSELSLARKEKLALVSHLQEVRAALKSRQDQCKVLQQELQEVTESAKGPQRSNSSPCDDPYLTRLLEECALLSGSGPLEHLQDCLQSVKQELHALQCEVKQRTIPEATVDA